MIVTVGSLFVSLDVYNYNIVVMLCLLVFFVAWLFVCAVVETDQQQASTSSDIAKFRQYYYINYSRLCLYYLYTHILTPCNTYG